MHIVTDCVFLTLPSGNTEFIKFSLKFVLIILANPLNQLFFSLIALFFHSPGKIQYVSTSKQHVY